MIYILIYIHRIIDLRSDIDCNDPELEFLFKYKIVHYHFIGEMIQIFLAKTRSLGHPKMN